MLRGQLPEHRTLSGCRRNPEQTAGAGVRPEDDGERGLLPDGGGKQEALRDVPGGDDGRSEQGPADRQRADEEWLQPCGPLRKKFIFLLTERPMLTIFFSG